MHLLANTGKEINEPSVPSNPTKFVKPNNQFITIQRNLTQTTPPNETNNITFSYGRNRITQLYTSFFLSYSFLFCLTAFSSDKTK